MLFWSPITAAELLSPQQIILTWVADPATTQAVTWLMPPDPAAAIQYLSASEFCADFNAALQSEAQGVAFGGGETIYRYTVNLTDLTPDTEYVYRVGREGAWSKPARFITAAETEDFSFMYMGDVQAGYEEWGELLDSAYKTHPDIKFSLLGGDLTDKGNDLAEWGEFINAATGLFSRIPMMPAKGNHDGELFAEFFSLPDNGPRGVSETFYSFDYGNVHFVVLDTSNIVTENVKQWLAEDLQGTYKKWKFAVFHKPAYPVVHDNKGIDVAIREHWVPILEENKVDMVFVGHQHVYMRTHPLCQETVKTDSYGIVYVMGNAGSKYYAKGGVFPYKAVEEEGNNYQVIELVGDVLTMKSWKANGELIDSYTIDKTPQGPPERPRYSIIPKEDPAYSIGSTADGIQTMLVNGQQTGLKYFTVSIEPLVSANGMATAVFTHLRDGVQIGINAAVADYDVVEAVQAGFNIKGGDIVKAYIVDDLSSSINFNPRLLQ
jgi:hypothetical protein